jgi:D-alanine-D-alanine ligase-like ATP-grasp enzyme
MKYSRDNVDYVDVEPEYGYFTRLVYKNGQTRITYGNDLGLNPSASVDLAKDKGHTKFLLREMGINCPDGKEFLLPWWIEKIGARQIERGNTNMRGVEEILPYINEGFGFPFYIKPVNGSKGSGIYKIYSAEELDAVIDEYNANRIPVALVEKPVTMPDYRLVMLDGELISAYRRDPLAVVGDGKSSIEELLIKLKSQYDAEGRDTNIFIQDPTMQHALSTRNLILHSIPEFGHSVVLSNVSNLSKGGTSLDVTTAVASYWVELSNRIAQGMNLRMCGIDLACEDITRNNVDYSVIEVNAAQGLDHYASSGQEQLRIVDELYTKVLNKA